MQNILNIMKRELERWTSMQYFYLMLSVFFLSIGLYSWFFYEQDGFFDIDKVIPSCLQMIYWGMAVFVPLLATGVIIEERKSDMLKILLSKPIKIGEVVLGKLGAIIVILFLFLLLTSLHYVSILSLTEVKISYLLFVYSFLLLLGVAYSAISMAVASFFYLYWKSYLCSYLIIFSIHFLASILGDLSIAEVQLFFNYVGMHSHFDYFLSGGFALSSVVYLLSIIIVSILTTIYKLSKDN